MNLSSEIIIKAQLGDDIRRIPIHNAEINHDELILMMQRVFKLKLSEDGDLLIKYKDEDGDFITIADESDLSYAIKSNNVLQIKLFVKGETDTVDSEHGVGDQSDTDRRAAWSKLGDRSALVSELRRLRDHITVLVDSLDTFVVSSVAPAPGVAGSAGFNSSSSTAILNEEHDVRHLEHHKEFDPLSITRQSEFPSNGLLTRPPGTDPKEIPSYDRSDEPSISEPRSFTAESYGFSSTHSQLSQLSRPPLDSTASSGLFRKPETFAATATPGHQQPQLSSNMRGGIQPPPFQTAPRGYTHPSMDLANKPFSSQPVGTVMPHAPGSFPPPSAAPNRSASPAIPSSNVGPYGSHLPPHIGRTGGVTMTPPPPASSMFAPSSMSFNSDQLCGSTMFPSRGPAPPPAISLQGHSYSAPFSAPGGVSMPPRGFPTVEPPSGQPPSTPSFSSGGPVAPPPLQSMLPTSGINTQQPGLGGPQPPPPMPGGHPPHPGGGQSYPNMGGPQAPPLTLGGPPSQMKFGSGDPSSYFNPSGR